jgi:hypothetical protein
MPSFLVTKKMSPELKARVQASVEGRRAAPGKRLAPRAMSLLRISLFLTAIVTVVLLVLSFRRVRLDLDSQRSTLLERVRKESSTLTPEDHNAPDRLLPWLAMFAGSYEGDLIADEIRSANAFQNTIRRPTVYVRGPLAGFGGGARLRDSASGSFKDAFVLCLNTPPKARTEKLLKAKARIAFNPNSDGMSPTLHVFRVYDVLVGLRFLSPEWEDRVVSARSAEEVASLKKDFDRVPIETVKRAVRAELLLAVMDEPSDKPGPSELDGERPHDIRVGLVDLAKRKVLLRLRRRVDPGWVSASTRAEYASGIDSCSLALEVHAAVEGREVAVQ